MFKMLTWLEPHASRFGVRCLDCRPFSQSMLSTTDDPKIVARFSALRASDGHEHAGMSPSNAVFVETNLTYRYDGDSEDGPLFVAEVMEDKWDIYLYDGYLYFTRSWTGELVFKARVEFGPGRASVSLVEIADRAAEDEAFALRQVDFLIKSHVMGREVPHPLPPDMPEEIETIALYSFSSYGRKASFATFEDTTCLADGSH